MRIWRWFKSEANSVIDQIEDEVKLTQQGIRDLKVKLNQGQHALAVARADSIQAQRTYNSISGKPEEYEKKAVLLLQKAKDGSLSEEQADRLATEALTKKESFVKEVAQGKRIWELLKSNADQFETEVKKLKTEIEKWDRKVKELESRKHLADSRVALQKQLSDLDPSSTVSMLKKMEGKIDEAEALAQAHEEIGSTKTTDEEINAALGAVGKSTAVVDSLAELKKRLN